MEKGCVICGSPRIGTQKHCREHHAENARERRALMRLIVPCKKRGRPRKEKSIEVNDMGLRRFSDEIEADMVRVYPTMSLADMEVRFKSCKETIKRILRRHKVELRVNSSSVYSKIVPIRDKISFAPYCPAMAVEWNRKPIRVSL